MLILKVFIIFQTISVERAIFHQLPPEKAPEFRFENSLQTLSFPIGIDCPCKACILRLRFLGEPLSIYISRFFSTYMHSNGVVIHLHKAVENPVVWWEERWANILNEVMVGADPSISSKGHTRDCKKNIPLQYASLLMHAVESPRCVELGVSSHCLRPLSILGH